MASRTLDFDVVVVGHGIAGMSAAVSAMQSGAKVAVLERAPAEESGGCTRYTEAFLRLKSEEELSDDFEELMAEYGSANPDPTLVGAMAGDPQEWPSVVRSMPVTDPEYLATFASEAVPTITWLKSFGVRFIPTRLQQISCRNDTPMITPSGGGHALIEALGEAARKGGVEFFYETTARSLVQDDEGAVSGVKAVGRNNRLQAFHARSVILASGGFEGSPEMLQRYLGKGAVNIRPVARGARFNRGDGIRMATEIGALPSGDYGAFHATAIDQRSGRTEPKILTFPYGIMVNKLGRRFTDEGASADYSHFDNTAYAIQAQPDGTAYVIFDAKLDDVPDHERAVFTDRSPIQAGSIDDLARQLDLPVTILRETVQAFNAACRTGRFDATEADGLRTEGIWPPKSNWARPIETVPFTAYPLVPAATITYGGIKTNADAQVLNCDGEVIPGLYASGAMVGVYYRRYVGATSVLRGATFGRIAGRHAAFSNSARTLEVA